MAPNVVGKRRANVNVKIINDYKYFFLPIQESARCYFLIELAKFFDKNYSQSLSINSLLNFIEKNIRSFSRDEFIKYHSERGFTPELIQGYKEFSIEDIKKIRKRLKRNEKKIEKVQNYRDKFLAHDDVKKIEIEINAGEVKTLFKIVENLIDLFCLRFEFSSNIYSNYEKEPIRAVDRIVSILQKYEMERLKKI